MPGLLGITPNTQSIAYDGEGGGGPPPSNAVYVSGTTWVITGNTWIVGDTTTAAQVKFNIVVGSIGTTQLENLSVSTGKLAADAVTFAKMQNLSGSTTFVGRFTASAGDPEELTGASATQMLSQFSGTTQGVVPGSGGGSSNFLRADGTWAAPPSGSGNFGTAVVDFGAFPGASDASIGVTGQAAIVAGSKINAWLRLEATADHSADEHWVESIRVFAGNIVAGTGFTIYARNDSELSEPLEWAHPAHIHIASSTAGQNTAPQVGNPWRGGQGTRIYGQWTLQWQWA